MSSLTNFGTVKTTGSHLSGRQGAFTRTPMRNRTTPSPVTSAQKRPSSTCAIEPPCGTRD
jgi:hypothetical protein